MPRSWSSRCRNAAVPGCVPTRGRMRGCRRRSASRPAAAGWPSGSRTRGRAPAEPASGHRSTIPPMVTEGDRPRPLPAAIGGKGLFIRNLNRRCLPGGRPCRPFDEGRAGRTAGGIHDRRSTRARDPRDAFVSCDMPDSPACPMAHGSAPRAATAVPAPEPPTRSRDPTAARQCRDAPRQARIRGPDAIVLAVAGLERLGLGGRIRNTRAGIVLAGGRGRR